MNNTHPDVLSGPSHCTATFPLSVNSLPIFDSVPSVRLLILLQIWLKKKQKKNTTCFILTVTWRTTC